MFEPKPQGSLDLLRQYSLFLCQQQFYSGPDFVLISKDFGDRRPRVRDLAMSMALLRVINIRVNTPFKDCLIMTWLCRFLTCCSGEVYIEESRNVSEIEETAIAQIDRPGEQILFRDHMPGHQIPCRP